MDDELTQLLNADSACGRIPSDQLLPLVYQKLRQVAADKMSRESEGYTLQATVLVHEAWMRVGGASQGWENRWHFFTAAAEAMRRILIDRARSRNAKRNGGGLERVDVNAVEISAPAKEGELLEVHEALDGLAAAHPRKAELVKLRYFIGLTLAEAAHVLGISTPTAERDWAVAKVWLHREISRRRENDREN